MCSDCPCGRFISFNKGDSISRISQKNSLTEREVLDANPYLNPTYYICGQVVVLPDESEDKRGLYRVKSGETLCDVLRKTNSSAAEIIAVNPNMDIFHLNAGDELNVPIKKLSSSNDFCRMTDGENLSTLSARTGIPPLELLKMNPDLRPSEFCSGQTVRISIPRR